MVINFTNFKILNFFNSYGTEKDLSQLTQTVSILTQKAMGWIRVLEEKNNLFPTRAKKQEIPDLDQ